MRRRCLSPGWYPSTPERARQSIELMLGDARQGRPETHHGEHGAPDGQSDRGIAGIVPHAGWEFSGQVALEVLSSVARGFDTIDTTVIIGGHLGRGDGILCSFEESWETPLGPAVSDLDLLSEIRRSLEVSPDTEADNTVEVQLPFIRYLLPTARVLGMRAPPSLDSVRLGAAIAESADRLSRRVVVIGSTDLTHYGVEYSFTPKGQGEEAVRWVRDVNDRRMVACLVAMDAGGALERAVRERSACSIGGALAAIGYAKARGITAGRLLDYRTSYDVAPSDSFVGYAGVLYG